MNSRSAFLAFLALLAPIAIAACQAPSRKLDLPRDQIAEIRGLDEYALLGTARHLYFQAVDGDEHTYGSEVEVTAGKHTLRCSYWFTFDNRSGPSGKTDVELEARAGAAYQGHLELGPKGEPMITFAEISLEEAEAARQKAKRMAEDAAGTGG